MPRGTTDNGPPALRHSPLVTSGRGGTCAQGGIWAGGHVQGPGLPSWKWREGISVRPKAKVAEGAAMHATPPTRAFKRESAFLNGHISHFKKSKFSLQDLAKHWATWGAAVPPTDSHTLPCPGGPSSVILDTSLQLPLASDGAERDSGQT